MINNKDFNFKRFVELFSADVGDGLLDIGDVMLSIKWETYKIGKTLAGIEKQLERIADRYCGEERESENERNTNND